MKFNFIPKLLRQLQKGQLDTQISCAKCRYYHKDPEYNKLGDCGNSEVRGSNAKIILNYCNEFYIADDFGCIYFEKRSGN